MSDLLKFLNIVSFAKVHCYVRKETYLSVLKTCCQLKRMLYFIFDNFKHILVHFMHLPHLSRIQNQLEGLQWGHWMVESVRMPTMGTLNGYAIWHICLLYMYYIVNKYLCSYVDYIDCITVVLIVLGYKGIKV